MMISHKNAASVDYSVDIAFLLPHLSGGGVERHFLKLIQHLAFEGKKIDLLLFTASGERLKDVPENIRIIDFESSSHRNAMPRNISRLITYLNNVQPRVMHSACDRVNVCAALAGFLAKAPTRVILAQVTSVDLQEISWLKPTRLLHYIMVRLSFPLADAIITPSYGITEEIKKFPFMKKPITPIHNGLLVEIDMKRANPVTFPKDKPTIVAAARLSKEKDYPCLLNAFSKAVKKVPSRLVILGEGSERQRLEQLAHELGIAGDVTFKGYVDNSLDYMQAADVFVLSSIKEGFGLSVLEALCVGTKVVSTDCKHGPAEILDGGKYGWLVPIKNPDALAKALIDALQSGEPDADYQGALAKHLEQFSYPNHFVKYKKALGF